VNGDQTPRARENDDGSVDVWLRAHRLHFPGGGREPIVTDDEQPPTDAGEVPRDVLLDVGEPVTTVSYDGWYVRLSPAGVNINQSRARRPLSRVFNRSFGRDG
jgi:hypothetical protein